jgi:hypothetical protein
MIWRPPLADQGTLLVFAELKDPVMAKLHAYQLDPAIPVEQFYPTIKKAVAAYREATGVDWVASRSETPTGSSVGVSVDGEAAGTKDDGRLDRNTENPPR